ncbi:hypothetical protein IQ250_01485 [Pseudanabaenaceae cyanobacterium LEGE 13415]|nr:hypothetical protein [Pseudanabaenaceae cyanobacterium LEGE 13415]
MIFAAFGKRYWLITEGCSASPIKCGSKPKLLSFAATQVAIAPTQPMESP